MIAIFFKGTFQSGTEVLSSEVPLEDKKEKIEFGSFSSDVPSFETVANTPTFESFAKSSNSVTFANNKNGMYLLDILYIYMMNYF